MKLKKNIIIFGPSRSGKTSLAIRLSKKLKYSVFMCDSLVTAFEQTFPELEITHKNRNGESVNNLKPFLLNYIRTCSSRSKARRGINYVYEGSYFDFDMLMSHEIQKRHIIIFLLNPYECVEDYFHQLKTHDKKHDWTYEISDEKLLDYCNVLKSHNDYLLTLYQQHNIQYYNTSINRKKVLNKIIRKTKKDIKINEKK